MNGPTRTRRALVWVTTICAGLTGCTTVPVSSADTLPPALASQTVLRKFVSANGPVYELVGSMSSDTYVLKRKGSPRELLRWSDAGVETVEMLSGHDASNRKFAVFYYGTEPSFPRKRARVFVIDELRNAVVLDVWSDADPTLRDVDHDGVLELTIAEDRYGDLIERGAPLWPTLIALGDAPRIIDFSTNQSVVRDFVAASEAMLASLEARCAESSGDGVCHFSRTIESLRAQVIAAKRFLR